MNSIWTDSKSETYIKTETGTKTFYRFLVEQFLGFEIPEGYTVHHIDWDHSNNQLSNFLVIPTPVHVWIHRTGGTQGIFTSNLEKLKKHPELIQR